MERSDLNKKGKRGNITSRANCNHVNCKVSNKQEEKEGTGGDENEYKEKEFGSGMYEFARILAVN